MGVIRVRHGENKEIKIKRIMSVTTLSNVVTKFLNEYSINTPTKLKIIDAYLTYVFLTGVIQFVYCCLVGTFPFNAFLSGFISCVGSFILGVCLPYKSILKTRVNSKGSALKEHLPTLFLHTSFYI